MGVGDGWTLKRVQDDGEFGSLAYSSIQELGQALIFMIARNPMRAHFTDFNDCKRVELYGLTITLVY